MTALEINYWVLGVTCFLTWFLSIPTKDHSWVDRIWSIVPIVYAWVFASGAGFTDARLNLMAALITLWGARLTFNFARKGGYAPGGEDYRWEILRKRMSRWQYEIFNVVFIVIIQNLILFAITLPMNELLLHPSPLNSTDIVLAALFLGLLTLETVADQQQWNFHQFKKAEKAAGRSVEPGFVTTGLFGFSRHPNFFAEQAQWWVIYLFAALSVGFSGFTWVGAVVLTGLFIGSTRFTEEISASKYPEYRQYQKRVSMLIPLPSRSGETDDQALTS
jgi:steroid 5-alpha reductase family enzyme